MPDTQQQWLEEQLAASAKKRGSFNMQLIFLDSQKPTSSAIALASDLAAAWPSSPQGLAAKQVVEAAELQVLNFERQNLHPETNFLGDDDHEAWTALTRALDAARKAGLTS